jgi:hypothetical protein
MSFAVVEQVGLLMLVLELFPSVPPHVLSFGPQSMSHTLVSSLVLLLHCLT